MRTCVLLILAVLCMTSCAGDGERSSLVPAGLGSVPVLLSDTAERNLPALPQDSVPPALQRIASSSNAAQVGRAYIDASAGVAHNLNSATINSTTDTLSWAMYRFSGVPGEHILGCGFNVSGLEGAERLYFAVSDYQHDSWHFFAEQNVGAAEFTLDSQPGGRWQSSFGNSYLLVLGWDGAAFDVESVQLTYAERFSATGMVVDKDGAAVPGVLVSTPLGGLSTFTDEAGQYELGGLPNGSWPLLATKDGWTFYNQPESVSIAGADATGPTLLGDPHGSHFTRREAIEGNDEWENPPEWDFSTVLEETLSAIDDNVDAYSFEVTSAGSYYLRFSSLGTSLSSTYSAVYSSPLLDIVAETSSIYQGDFLLGFHVTEPGQRFVFYVNCAAGGGDYTVSLESGETFLIGGQIKDGADNPMSRALIDIDNADAGLSTTVFNNSYSSLPFNFHVTAWLPGQTNIEPHTPDYTFAPQEQLIDLTGERLDIDFIGSPGSFADSFEPNNEKSEATLLSSLPYAGTDPLSIFPVSAGGSDPSDVFKIVPSIGKGVRVRVVFDKLATYDYSIEAALDNDAALNVYAEATAEGLALLLPESASGDPYYITVSTYQSRAFNYRLFVDVFDAAPLQFAVRVLPDTLLPEARFVVHDEFFNAPHYFHAEDDGLSRPLFLPAGTELHVECMRYGMSVDRNTRKVIVGDTPATIFFDAADQLPDSFEPNSSYIAEELPAPTLPATVDATISWISDASDHYRLDPVSDLPFKFEFDSPNSHARLACAVFDSTDQLVGASDLTPGLTFYAPNDGQPGQRIEVYNGEQELPYTLAISEQEAHVIIGHILDDSAQPIAGSQVYNVTLDRQYEVEADGSYISEPLGPGTYTMHYLALNHEPEEKTVDVVVGNFDVAVGFSGMVAEDKDDLEPNNSPPSAATLELETVYSANVGNGADLQDYYRFEAQTGQKIVISMHTLGDTQIYSTVSRGNDGQFGLGYVYRTAPGELRFVVNSPVALSYLIEVTGYDNYTIELNELP